MRANRSWGISFAKIILTSIVFLLGYWCGNNSKEGEIRIWVSHNKAGKVNVQLLSDTHPETLLHHTLLPFEYHYAEEIIITLDK